MKFMIQAGGVLGALAVALGAFGAHAFKGMLEASGRTDTFETAVKYQFYHAIAMVLVGLLMQRAGADAVRMLGWAGNAFAIGVIIFMQYVLPVSPSLALVHPLVDLLSSSGGYC
jgi:uncharacterized membrane protein YgdD (TMEM256/DUF423 family)